MAKPRALTHRQLAFIQHYTTHGPALYNATEAASKAGYKGSRVALSVVGCENLRKVSIQAAIQTRLTELYRSNNITTDRVLNDIEMTRQMALADGNWNAALKASELHGKYLTMFSERIEHVHTLEETPMAELDRLASTLLEKVYGVTLPGITRDDGSEDSTTPGADGDRTTH